MGHHKVKWTTGYARCVSGMSMGTFYLEHVNVIIVHLSQNFAVTRRKVPFLLNKMGKHFGLGCVCGVNWVPLTLKMSRSVWGYSVHFSQNWAVTGKWPFIELNG